MKQFLSVILFFGVIWSVTGQKLYYDVIRSGSLMGNTVVDRIITGDELTYHLNTKTEVKILFTFEVEYDLKETFRNGVLQSGSSFSTLKGSTQKKTSLKKKEGLYELVIDGIRTEISEKSIAESVSEIYFEEPFDGKKVFSAYFGRYLSFVKTADHKYSLTSPDGTNEYTYENGICTKVYVTRDFASFTFVLKPESLLAVRNRKITSSIPE